jgi:hypothetical protein
LQALGFIPRLGSLVRNISYQKEMTVEKMSGAQGLHTKAEALDIPKLKLWTPY